MSTSQYFFNDIKGRRRGPFSEQEIVALLERNVLSPETTINDQRGESLTASEIEQIVAGKGNSHSTPPPPPRKSPPRPQAPVSDDAPYLWISRRAWLGWLVLMATAYISKHLLRLWKQAQSPRQQIDAGGPPFRLPPPDMSRIRISDSPNPNQDVDSPATYDHDDGEAGDSHE